MENSIWKTTNDEFRGYTRAKLEEIHASLAEICIKTKSHEDRLDAVEMKLSNRMAINKALFGIAAAIGAVVTFLGTILDKIFHFTN